MNRDKALSKIKKCLALAASSNRHEAAAAMRQAQKLMAEYGLTESDVSLADVAEREAPARMAAITRWESTLARIIAVAFGCEHFSRTNYTLPAWGARVKQRGYVFVGVGAAPEIASYAYTVLARQCAKDRLTHIRKQPKNCKPITKTARGDQFAMGWVYGVADLVETFAGAERNHALIEQYMERHHPDLAEAKVKDSTKGRNISHNDLAQGHQAGRSARLSKGLDSVAQRELLA
ncbi:hypothetical protein AEP_00431 [Curvibacter sp. AEP1-3]|uniref:DUF2786 domain-containing protein n=1 Tax=Curvibacter sp. AEP1-3 TaxID=1844971 RepID=UPI000B3CC494|nr:DUF2786 domain-containing protein [Curvibacter sp. AEP1-3]ARV17393.1 hypothetical protein AEP_00431 [Curvibacter sp. AEP1-3]QDB70130.1 hypothetical protein [Curvibacter phage TJ1]